MMKIISTQQKIEQKQEQSSNAMTFGPQSTSPESWRARVSSPPAAPTRPPSFEPLPRSSRPLAPASMSARVGGGVGG
jgi:hypothetical protein